MDSPIVNNGDPAVDAYEHIKKLESTIAAQAAVIEAVRGWRRVLGSLSDLDNILSQAHQDKEVGG
jgi:hypothetical protein